MPGIVDVVSNSGEDFIDELTSAIVYDEGSKVFKKLKEDLGLDPNNSKIDEALEGALSTLQYGLMNIVIVTVTEYALTKSIVIFTGLIAFIKGRSIVQKTKSTAQNLFQKIGKVGGMPFRALQGAMGAIVGSQEQTLAIAKMGNDTANNLTSIVAKERQNQIMLQSNKLNRIDNAKKNIYSVRNNSRSKNMDLFMHKFNTATWKDTLKDKKLYFDCTGQDDKVIPFNDVLIKKLNSYANIVETASGQIYTQAKATLDLITQIGVRA